MSVLVRMAKAAGDLPATFGVAERHASPLTMVTALYDRFAASSRTFGHEYVPNSARVFRYDSAFGLQRAAARVRAVSDHFPVFAEFTTTGPDDDGR